MSNPHHPLHDTAAELHLIAAPPLRQDAAVGDNMARAKDQRPHVIVVEDEAFQRETLVEYLDGNGYRTSGVEAGAALRKLVEKDPPALVLLDLRLPGGEDGFALARWLRERSGKLGIIMVTASGDTINRVVGLETGADDYIAKPFEPRELLARVKALLRRVGGSAAAARTPRVRMGRCMLDLEARTLTTLSGEDVPLRAGEFELLKLLAENPNRALTRDWLLETISHREMDVFDRAIDIRILRLRRKVEADPARPTSIRTVRGAGYMFVPPDD
jgi:two-component system phosphate regulon response regulator OmpR